MKLTFCSAVGLSVALSACTSLDPEYADYKKQKEAEAAAAAQSPYGQGADPYGVPGGSSMGETETGSYAPLDPLPSAYTQPPSPEPISPLGSAPSAGFGESRYPTIPSGSGPNVPSGPTTPHVVVKGDSLWGLARRYNTTVEAIKQTNGLSSDTIQTGRTLQIPQH